VSRDDLLDGMLMLAAAMGGEKLDDVVESMGRGKQGQQNAKETLPRKFQRAEDKVVLEELGFKFGEPVDKLFLAVTFPEGWKKKRTDHYMWNDLVDPKGKKRGSFFYKPDFWDQDAFLRLDHRYHVGRVHFPGNEDHYRHFQCEVKDWDEKILFVGTRQTHPNPSHSRLEEAGSQEAHSAYWKLSDELEKKARQECVDWIEARCPDHTNVRLYWDLEILPDPIPVPVAPPEPPTQVAEAEEPTKIEPNPKAKAKRKKKGTAT
jgi:hypothetical protein